MAPSKRGPVLRARSSVKAERPPGASGFEVRRSCLQVVFDCRSRRAARGQERPGVKSAWKRPRSSRPPLRRRGGERASEAGSRAAKPWHRWRARVRGPLAFPKGWGGGPSGHSSMEGASGRSEPQPLTRWRGRRSRWRAARRKTRSSSRRGRQRVDAHSPSAEDNTAERGAPLRGLADIGAHQGIRGARHPPDRRGRERNRPKRVERRQARHGPARRLGFAPGGRAPREREATPGIER